MLQVEEEMTGLLNRGSEDCAGEDLNVWISHSTEVLVKDQKSWILQLVSSAEYVTVWKLLVF